MHRYKNWCIIEVKCGRPLSILWHLVSSLKRLCDPQACFCFCYVMQHLFSFYKSSSLSDRCIMGIFRPVMLWHVLCVTVWFSVTVFLHVSPMFSNDFSRMVAEEYLQCFSFTGMALDQALRSAHLIHKWKIKHKFHILN